MRSRHVLVVVALLAVGCASIERSAAWNPDAHAPSSPSTPWTPPEAKGLDHYLPPRSDALASAALVPDSERVYDLVDLIDLAERANPDTRRAWEEARAAAARLGRTESRYLPVVGLAARGGWEQTVSPRTLGTEIVDTTSLQPTVDLAWLLVDFGRRDADREHASQELLAAGFAFNRRHQEVAFAVERSFYAFDASRAEVEASEAALQAADAVLEASVARRSAGLATQPEVLLARQQQVQAAYELERARGLVEKSRAALAHSIGIPPTVPLRVSDLAAQPLPGELVDTVERVIDSALANRPDLAARLATLRAREAQIRRAQADILPRIGVTGEVGGVLQDYRAGPPFSSHSDAEPLFGGFLTFEWTLFDGLERQNAIREAEAQAGAARADLAALEQRTLRKVWTAYADVKTALRKHEFATALLRASEDAYSATTGVLSRRARHVPRPARRAARAGAGAYHQHREPRRPAHVGRDTRVCNRRDVPRDGAVRAPAGLPTHARRL